MADRCPRAGQVLEVLDVMLMPEHVRWSAAFQRGADPVGSGELLSVAEPGRQPHFVQFVLQPGVAGAAVQDHAFGVGEDDADRFVGMLGVCRADDCVRAVRETRLAVEIGFVRQLEVVGGHLPLPGPGPRRENGVPDDAGLDRFGGQEPFTGLRQPALAPRAQAFGGRSVVGWG